MFVIERRDFLPLVREEPEIATKLIEILCGRLRRTTQQVEGVMFLHLPGRLAKALLRLSGGGGVTREPKIAVTQKDLANTIGMSRESTNRQLRFGQRTNGSVLNAAELPFCPWKPWKELLRAILRASECSNGLCRADHRAVPLNAIAESALSPQPL
jgi:Crp-like helix-turn-helix domain